MIKRKILQASSFIARLRVVGARHARGRAGQDTTFGFCRHGSRGTYGLRLEKHPRRLPDTPASSGANDGGYRAHNPEQHWRLDFDGRGFIARPEAGGWEWGLELKSYGFSGQKRETERAEVTAERRVRICGKRGCTNGS